MLSKFLDPKNDLAFKRIFGTERNKDILIHFLNDIFGRTSNAIESVEFIKTSQNPEVESQRVSSVDVLCQDVRGERFIVEMQVNDESGFEKRAQYYAARTYIEQREKGIAYKDLKEVTFLGIMAYTLFPEAPDYLHHHAMLDLKTHDRWLKDFSFSFLELPKFKKKKDQLFTLTEKWAYFLKYAPKTTEEDLPDIIGSDRIIQRAYNELSRYAWSAEDLRQYENLEMKHGAYRATIETSFSKGKAVGIEQGKHAACVTMAKQLHIQGIDFSVIQKTTGLSNSELEVILKALS